MRAARVGHRGDVRVGHLTDGEVHLAPGGEDDLVRFLVTRGWEELAAAAVDRVRLEECRMLAPVPRPSKVLGIGLNYRDHAEEQGKEAPTDPVVFAIFPNAVIGPDDPIPLHPITTETDYEAELAVVIGRRARGVDREDALAYVLGYTILNDVTARDLQHGDAQWVRAKGLDGYAPMGPVLVSPDEVGDPGDLAIECLVNGEVRQSSRTSNLIFDVSALIEHLSQCMTLEPGDVIATGTPGGVGTYMDPPRYLREGDRVTVRVERIGELSNPVG